MMMVGGGGRVGMEYVWLVVSPDEVIGDDF
jgi:hypothetical protein